MPPRATAALLSLLAISLISVLAAALLLRGKQVQRYLPLLVALSAGALIGDTFLHLLPHAVAAEGGFTPTIGWGVLGGLLGFFLIESLLHWHHHGEDVHEHGPDGLHSFGVMNLIGDGIHNFIDGCLVAGAWLVSEEAGLATSLAVLMHEVPQEFGDFGVLRHAGYSFRRALLCNLGVACASFLGALLVLTTAAGSEIADLLLPVTAGGFLYIACADLVPEMRKRARGWSLVATVLALGVGLGAMALVSTLEGGSHDAHAGHPHAAPPSTRHADPLQPPGPGATPSDATPADGATPPPR